MEHNDAIKRRIKRNQMQRNVRRSEIALKRFFSLIRFLLIVAIIFLTYKLVHSSHWYVSDLAFKSPKNEYLKIVGNQITPDYKILNALRRTEIPKKPIYLIKTKEMEKQILQIEPIKRVYIRRFWWPGRFTILVEERKPILIISPSETVAPIAFFAEGGKLIGREYLPLKSNFKPTLILTYGNKGDDYRRWNDSKIKMLDKLAKNLSAYSGEKVQYIDIRNPHDAYAQLTSVKLRLGELDATVFKRIQSISSILPQIKSFNKKIKYVDLRWEETNYLKLEYDNGTSSSIETKSAQNSNNIH